MPTYFCMLHLDNLFLRPRLIRCKTVVGLDPLLAVLNKYREVQVTTISNSFELDLFWGPAIPNAQHWNPKIVDSTCPCPIPSGAPNHVDHVGLSGVICFSAREHLSSSKKDTTSGGFYHPPSNIGPSISWKLGHLLSTQHFMAISGCVAVGEGTYFQFLKDWD